MTHLSTGLLPLAGFCPSKTHSAAQPYPPQHPPHGQPIPTIPADSTGLDQSEEQQSLHWAPYSDLQLWKKTSSLQVAGLDLGT